MSKEIFFTYLSDILKNNVVKSIITKFPIL